MRRIVPVLMAAVAGIIIAPVVAPTLARLGRPVAKTGIKAGLAIFRSGRVKVAELAETLEDLLADARSELSTPVTDE